MRLGRGRGWMDGMREGGFREGRGVCWMGWREGGKGQ